MTTGTENKDEVKKLKAYAVKLKKELVELQERVCLFPKASLHLIIGEINETRIEQFIGESKSGTGQCCRN